MPCGAIYACGVRYVPCGNVQEDSPAGESSDLNSFLAILAARGNAFGPRPVRRMPLRELTSAERTGTIERVVGERDAHFALGAFAAAQAVGLFLLVRTRPAESLTLSETTLTLKMDEGRRISHTVEPASAARKLLKYKVSASDEVIAWIDDRNEMIIAVSPGTCTIKATLDGLTAAVDVTVTEETVLAGMWKTEDEDVRLLLDHALSGRLETETGVETILWTRDAFTEGENDNPLRYVKLTGERNGARLVLYYDRLSDTLRLHVDGTEQNADRTLVRG